MERVYTIPLRREYLKVPRWKRAKKAMKAIREFTMRHMKVEDPDNVKISNKVNEVIWEGGGKRVPPKITVKMIKEEEVVYVLLPDEELKKKEEKKKVEKTKEEKPKKENQPKEEEKKEEVAEQPKEEVKEEVKEDERGASSSPGEQES
jgi:large subunit ribosomal protein L31e